MGSGRDPVLSPAQRAWRTECEGWVALGQAPEAAGIYRVTRYRGMVLIRRDPRARYRLPALILVEDDTLGEPAERLQVALDLLGPLGDPLYLCVLEGDSLPGWEDALTAAWFERESTQLLMTCPLPRAPLAGDAGPAGGAARDPRLAVVRADAEADREAALAVVGEGFRDPPDVTAFYNARGVVRLYLARVAGEPAAAGALWPFAGVAGIYSITTRSRFRRQGVAYALVERMLDDATAAGFGLASLRTSYELEDLYARHGFRTAGRVARYRRQP
ncbi:MAG TPA: GNAT family N-acetyltransferase [Limnochordales bacterium]